MKSANSVPQPLKSSVLAVVVVGKVGGSVYLDEWFLFGLVFYDPCSCELCYLAPGTTFCPRCNWFGWWRCAG